MVLSFLGFLKGDDGGLFYPLPLIKGFFYKNVIIFE